LWRPYLNTTLFNNNEDYNTKSLCLMTAVGKLPKSVDNRATKGDLLEGMGKKRYRSASSHPELEPISVGKESILFPTGVLSKEEVNECVYGQWLNKDDIIPRKTDPKQNLTKFMLRNRLSKVLGVDSMLVTPGKVELNNTTKCQPRRFTFGVVKYMKHLHQCYCHIMFH
jgi:hypothetical protein